jgi:hypothetical protein
MLVIGIVVNGTGPHPQTAVIGQMSMMSVAIVR